MPAMLMAHVDDPREALLKELGDLSKVEVFNNQVLCAVYIRPEKTKSGLYIADSTRDEDKFQGKVGLIVKMGPQAFESDGNWFSDVKFQLHDWVVTRPSDGWNITVNGILCRLIDDIHVRARVDRPDCVW